MKILRLCAVLFAPLLLAGCMTSAPEITYTARHLAYSQTAVQAELTAGRDVVLNFRADWCPTCNSFSKEIMANQNTMADTTRVVDVDYDTATDLKTQYGVTKQHTFVLLNADSTMRAKTQQISTIADLNAFVSANSAPIAMTEPTVVAEAPVGGGNTVTNTISTGIAATTTPQKERMTEETMMDKKPEPKKDMMADKESLVETKTPAVVAGKTDYQVYSSAAVAQAHANGQKVVLFFAADRCPSCVSADKEFAQEKGSDKNIALFKVNYDKETDLKTTYGVTYQHTFVQIDATGALVKKRSGSQSCSDLSAQVQ